MTDNDKAIKAALTAFWDKIEIISDHDLANTDESVLAAIAAYESARNGGRVPVAWKHDDTLVINYDHLTWLREKMSMLPPTMPEAQP